MFVKSKRKTTVVAAKLPSSNNDGMRRLADDMYYLERSQSSAIAMQDKLSEVVAITEETITKTNGLLQAMLDAVQENTKAVKAASDASRELTLLITSLEKEREKR